MNTYKKGGGGWLLSVTQRPTATPTALAADIGHTAHFPRALSSRRSLASASDRGICFSGNRRAPGCSCSEKCAEGLAAADERQPMLALANQNGCGLYLEPTQQEDT